MVLGACPYCQSGHIEVRDKEVRGKKLNFMPAQMHTGIQKMENFLS